MKYHKLYESWQRYTESKEVLRERITREFEEELLSEGMVADAFKSIAKKTGLDKAILITFLSGVGTSAGMAGIQQHQGFNDFVAATEEVADKYGEEALEILKAKATKAKEKLDSAGIGRSKLDIEQSADQAKLDREMKDALGNFSAGAHLDGEKVADGIWRDGKHGKTIWVKEMGDKSDQAKEKAWKEIDAQASGRGAEAGQVNKVLKVGDKLFLARSRT